MNYSEYVAETGTAFGADRPAIYFADEVWTHGELHYRACRMAAVLAHHGVARGDRVVALMGNRPEYYVGYLAAARLGAIYTTINLDYTNNEIGHMMRSAEPACAITDAAGHLRYLELRSANEIPDVPFIGADHGPVDEGSRHYLEVAPEAPVPALAEMSGEEGVLLCYTSGSSGMPKPVLTSQAGEKWATRSFRNMWRFNSNDRVVVALPLAWVYGLGTVSMPALSSGGSVILLPKFRPDTVCDAIARHRATAMVGVTTMYRMIVEYADEQASRPDLSSLQLAMTGGERRNEAVFSRFEALSGVPVFDIYACSECRPILGYDPMLDDRPRQGSAGRLFPGVEAELRDDDGFIVPPGTPGELFVRSPNAFLEYYREPEMTKQRRDADGWVRTGDMFLVDAQGYWHIQGRKSSDMINRAGAKISPAEVEAHLINHPRIKDAVVVPRPDPRYGEAAVACLLGNIRPDEALELVRKHCEGVLADYKIPTDVVVMEAFPYGPTGKVDRASLVEIVRREHEKAG